MNRTTWVGALVVLAAVVATATTAAPVFTADRVAQDVYLSPADDPNGAYAEYDEDGEVVVDLTAANTDVEGEGLNADSVTHIDDVLELRYNGSRYAHVWLTHESEDVTFYADGHPVQSESNNVTLGPNQSLSVGLRVDTRGETTDGFLDDVTIHAKVADPEDVDPGPVAVGGGAGSSGDPAIVLRRPNASARLATVVGAPDGEPTTLDLDALSVCREGDGLTLDEATVVREGAGNLDLRFRAVQPQGNHSAHTESLCAVEATETPDSATVSEATLRFSVDRDALARWGVSPAELVLFRTSDGETTELPVRIVDTSEERVRFAVETPGFSQFTVAAARPNVGVTTARLNRTTVAPNETLAVTGAVSNDGRANATQSLAVTLNGSPVATQSVSLAPGESRRVTVPVTPQRPGQYTVRLGNTTAGTIEVTGGEGDASEESADDVAAPPAADPTREPAGLGLGGIVGLVGALVATLAGLAGVRRWSR
jgi:hypothetical protein